MSENTFRVVSTMPDTPVDFELLNKLLMLIAPSKRQRAVTLTNALVENELARRAELEAAAFRRGVEFASVDSATIRGYLQGREEGLKSVLMRTGNPAVETRPDDDPLEPRVPEPS